MAYNSGTPCAIWMKFAGRVHHIKRDCQTKYEDNQAKRMKYFDLKSATSRGCDGTVGIGACALSLYCELKKSVE